MARNDVRDHEVKVRLSGGEYAVLEKARKGASPAEYIRRLIMTASAATAIDPKYVRELESENECLTRANTELREKLQAAQVKASLTAEDDEQLRRDLTDAQAERDDLRKSLRQAELDAATAWGKADAYERCLESARLVPSGRED